MSVDISICVITYNHENFVARALESINCQQFTGTIELIIGVDLSSDETAKVVEDFQHISNFPIKLIINTERRGMFGNLRDVLSQASGKYIAMLEGDDFWFDQKKLQKQFNYLEETPKCIATGGGIKTFSDSIRSTKKWNNRFDQYYFLEDLVHSNRLSFCTVMFRQESFTLEKYDELKDSPHLDWPIYLSLFNGRKDVFIKVFSEVFSVYRIHDGGVFSGVNEAIRKNNILKTMCCNLLMVNESFARKYVLTYIRYQEDEKKLCPSPKHLRNESELELTSILSFYLYNFRKRQIVMALLKNPGYFFIFFRLLCKKMSRRYRGPK